MLSNDSLITNQLENLKEKVFQIFDKTLKNKKEIVLAYSGGKDSTVLAILLYEWLTKIRPIPRFKMVMLHNDTLSEIEPIERWARDFMNTYKREMKKLGIDVNIKITYPKFDETFYWRVLVRGYVAPTNNFRWCVNLLKIKPSKRVYENGFNDHQNEKVVLIGLRNSESPERSKNFKKRYGSCGIGKCIASYLENLNGKTINKVAAISNWDSIHIFIYLRENGFFDVSPLLDLYRNPGLRYGCWHCTLVKYQRPLHILSPNYFYFEILRILYKLLSDIPSVRLKKNWGYSKYGGLNEIGRNIMWTGFNTVERLSGIKFYGLDEIKVQDISLRKLFYYIKEEEANQIILKNETRKERVIFLERIKYISYSKKKDVVNQLERLLNKKYNDLFKIREYKDKLDYFMEEIIKA